MKLLHKHIDNKKTGLSLFFSITLSRSKSIAVSFLVETIKYLKASLPTELYKSLVK